MVLSGFRSFDEQNTLKQNYLTQYGTGANTFSADQGYSEHQLGTTVDFTNSTIGENIDAFESTDEFEWLKRYAYRYGFVMSYPEGNAYYQYEPWHWRFVGKDLARDLHRDEEHFYDLEQREIDSYIAELFD
jgi:D-alanyl-D-alanine carboxypeptidase